MKTLFVKIIMGLAPILAFGASFNGHEYTTVGGKAFAPVIDLAANLCVREITEESLYRDMLNFKREGWTRVYVILVNPGCPFYANPWISMMTAVEGQPTNHMRENYERLGDPNEAVAAAAKKAGMEVWGVYKPYEGGGYSIPSAGHADGSIASIPTVGGLLVYNDTFLSAHPDLRLKRKPEVDPSKGKPITKIEVSYMLDAFTNVTGPAGRSTEYSRIKADDFQKTEVEIYASKDNGNYELLGAFMPDYHVEQRDIYDPNGFLLYQNSRCMVAVIDNLDVPADTDYLAIVPDEPGNRRLIPQTMIKAYASGGEEAPLSVSRYYRTAYFPDWQTGRPDDYEWGRETAPSSVWTAGAVENFKQWGFAFEWYGAGFWGDGWIVNPPVIGVGRGKLDYLKGTHCEGYPEVREHWLNNVKDFIAMGYDGIDFRLQYHSGMISDYVNYGFNAPLIERYQEVHGIDPSAHSSITAEVAMNMMKIRGEFFMMFLEDAVEILHASGRKAGIHLRYSNEDPTLSYGYNEMGFWAMPRIVIDWRRAVDLADEVTIKDYYHNNYRKDMSAEIKQYASDRGKFLWVHAYFQQGKEHNVEFISSVDADPNVDGLLGYELYLGAGKAIADSFSWVLSQVGYSPLDGEELAPDESALIAYEGFHTIHEFTDSGSAEHYLDNTSLGDRKAVVEGTIGFPFHPQDDGFHWMGTTKAMRTAIDAGLTHEGVALSHPGGLSVNLAGESGFHSYARRITGTFPSASSYYMSALICASATEARAGDECAFRSVGFGPARDVDNDGLTPERCARLQKGFHVGVEHVDGEGYLAAFVGGKAFRLARLHPDLVGRTVQLVLKLEVDEKGDESLTAWYAPQGSGILTAVPEVEAVNVGDVWKSREDLRHLIVVAFGCETTTTQMDEIYFGTTIESVTAIGLPK